MEIRCKKENCKHNTGCSCAAGGIEIDRATHCDSYACNPLKDELIQRNGNIFEVAEDLVPTNLKRVPLVCAAKACIYNKDAHCQASGITVVDDETHADCASFCEC